MINYSIEAKNNMLLGLLNLMDEADPLPSYILLYSDPVPSNPGDDITTQILLSNISLSLPSGIIADGVLTLEVPIEEDNAPNTGGVSWGRLLNGNDIWIADFDVTLTTGNGTLKLNDLNIYKGGIVRINFATFTTS